MTLLGIALCLVGGALIETPIIGYINGDNVAGAIVFGVICGLVFLVPGIIMIVKGVKGLFEKKWDTELKAAREALKPGFKEATDKSFLDKTLVRFREDYSKFMGKEYTVENEPIQSDVTQIFRNIMQFQKNRLDRLGLTCELLIKRMGYTKEDGVETTFFSDGKYKIIEVKEQVAAKTIYKKHGQEIYTKTDRDIANYTIIQAQQVGKDKIICPNCGVETNRDALLDGCDYCDTKFTVEDLRSRIAAFAFRPDAGLRYEKFESIRNKVLLVVACAAVLASFVGFTVLAIHQAPELLASADGGIILTVLACVLAIIIASPVYLLALIIDNLGACVAVALLLVLICYLIKKAADRRLDRMKPNQTRIREIRKDDPNFSVASFYSGVQNKLSSVIFAETAEQIQAFADGDISYLLGRFSDVVGIDVDRFNIANYFTDGRLKYIDVDAFLILTRYNGRRCVVRREHLKIRLAKAAGTKTQAVCEPAVMICKNCGTSLDLLQGKRCAYCGTELNLAEYDWVIKEISC